MIKLRNMVKVYLLIAVMMFILTGCVMVDISDVAIQKGSISGRGDMITIEYYVPEYTAVKIEANVQIVYKAATSDVVKVEIQKNLSEYLDIHVDGGQLLVASNKDFVTEENKVPVIYISTPTVTEWIFEGFVEIKEADPIKNSDLYLLISGALNGELEIDTAQLKLEFYGIGDIRLSGRASIADIAMNGPGSLDALELETQNSNILINRAGNISLSCSNTLSVWISGIGKVDYRGAPALQQNVSGYGIINQVE